MQLFALKLLFPFPPPLLSLFPPLSILSLLSPSLLLQAVDAQAQTTAEMEALTKNVLLTEQHQQRIGSSSPESDHSSGSGKPPSTLRSKESTSSLGSVVDPAP